MADVNIKYQGTSIATIDASGSKTLQTSGKYCEGDIVVEYTGPEKPTQAKSATPTETAQDITPDSGKALSKVSVGAIPKTYVGSGVTKKAAATVSPSTSEQTVCESGVYTTGEQKVSAITPSIVGNLDASSFAASIVAAVEGKGVTVPDGTLLDGMAALIESIEGGGGGCTITSGSFTPASDPTYGYTVTHGLGKIPEVFVCWISQNFTSPSVSSRYLCGIYSNSLNINNGLFIYNTNLSLLSAFRDITETTIRINNTNMLTAKTYSWIAVA